MTEAQFAAINSLFVVGGLFGALVSGPLSSQRGRLLAMRLTSLFFLLGSILETLAGAVWLMSTGRFLSGIGAGASTVIVPLYISEVAPPTERGLFGAMTQISINVGIVIVQTLGYFLSHGSWWRVILGSGGVIAIVQGLGLFFVPESPAWLAAHKDVKQAVQTLQRIRGHGVSIEEEISGWDVDNTSAEEEGLLSNDERRNSTTSKTSRDSIEHVGFFQVLRNPLYRPAIIAVIGIMFAQQLCGINSVMMYSVSLLSGVLPISSSLLTILLSLANLITTIACSPLPDKIGRKSCLLLSITGMGTASFLLATSLRLESKIGSAVSVLLFVSFFAVGLGPVPFLIGSELVGQEAVGATQSWCLAANYVATFLVAQFFPLLNGWLNGRFGGKGWVYFVFGVMAILSWGFIKWWVPETKGKKDADEVWGRTRRVD
jgi:sugar porter (SP) family MFS transporter